MRNKRYSFFEWGICPSVPHRLHGQSIVSLSLPSHVDSAPNQSLTSGSGLLTRSTRAKLAALFVPVGLPLPLAAWVWSIYRQARSSLRATGPGSLRLHRPRSADDCHPIGDRTIRREPAPALIAEQLTLLLPDYQTWLQSEISQTMAADIFWESERLRAVAKKEVELGNFNGTDPLNSIDLEACRLNLEPWQCVLLRYAGEGIQLYANAEDYTDCEVSA
jgi:hypothetical protein